MKTFTRSVAILTATTFLSSCALIEKFSYKPAELTTLEKAPKFDVKTFFSGDIEVFAITQDNNGKLIETYYLLWGSNDQLEYNGFTELRTLSGRKTSFGAALKQYQEAIKATEFINIQKI